MVERRNDSPPALLQTPGPPNELRILVHGGNFIWNFNLVLGRCGGRRGRCVTVVESGVDSLAGVGHGLAAAKEP